ncbi:SDR family oxidoreductase [Pseudoruegeria aquimaris]|uniref:SDR family oxidoreductase n=1 Tax=Pseudoruegeria aquimaris TaxID=393663 RepID=UPI000A26B663|nr:SDR family oxidoreductase [Pseudoruegeria aquimaris]
MSNIILITGCSSGLGASLAVQAAQAGHKVYATMRDLSRRGKLDDAAAQAGVGLEVLRLDVQDTASVEAAVAEIMAREGRIDVLVNNAGLGFARNVEQASEAEIQRVMDINFMGVVRCIKAVLPHMRKARGGHVVNITSVGGLVGQPFNEIYCGAKFAVEGLTESLACYVTPAFGVRFTAVEPGGITSEFANTVLREIAETGGMLEDEYLPILRKYVSGAQARQGAENAYQTPEEAAAVVLGVIGQAAPPVRIRTSEWAEAFTATKTGLDPDGTKLVAEVTARFLG